MQRSVQETIIVRHAAIQNMVQKEKILMHKNKSIIQLYIKTTYKLLSWQKFHETSI